jgi:hypothetical protein
MPSRKTALSFAVSAGLLAVATASELPRAALPIRPAAVVKPAPAPASYPDRKLAAAAARWKIKDAANRIRQAGAAGRHDLFWEVLTLLEKNDKARTDADLVAVMDWLLFKAELWKHKDLGPAAARKIPKLVPALGERLLEARLKEWVSLAAVRYGGGDPWTWPEFSGKGRKRLGKAARRLLATGPRHNPMTRVWIAAALVVAGEKNAGKELAEARRLLAERLPSKVNLVTLSLGNSLAAGGAKECLELLLDAAENYAMRLHPLPAPADRLRGPEALPGGRGKLLEGDGEVSAKPYYRRSYWPAPLTRFYSLVGWIRPADMTNLKEKIAAARKWLGANGAKLDWDAKTKRFSGGAFQPGLEAFHKAAAALKKKSGFDVVAGLSAGTHNAIGALQQLLAFGEKDAAAAKTAEFREVARGLIHLAGNTLSGYQTALMSKLSVLAPELATEVYISLLRSALVQVGSGGYYRLSSLNGVKPKVIEAACAKLLPEFKKCYESAAKSSDAAAKMYAGIAYLCVGGKLSQDEICRLLDDGFKTRLSYKHQLTQVAASMTRSGRTAGLRVMLAVARSESVTNGHNRHSKMLYLFRQLVGWGNRPATAGSIGGQVRKAEKWLDEHEKSLKWDATKGRFVGALAPEIEKLNRLCTAVEKRWGLKLRSDLSDRRTGHERAARAIVDLVRRKPKAADDENVEGLVEELATDILSTRFGAGRMLVDLPKANRKLGTRLWTAWIRRQLTVYNGSIGIALSRPEHTLQGVDLSLLPEGCKPLVKSFQANYENALKGKASTQEKLRKALACAYVGGTVEESVVRKLMKENSARRGIHDEYRWGSALAIAGRKLGLKVLLWTAADRPKSWAFTIGRFDYLSGRTDKKNARFHRGEPEEKVRAKVKARLEWLKANDAKLVWNAKTGRFKVNGKAVEPANEENGAEVF